MKKFQSLTFWKKPSVILALILAAFFLREAFVTALFPMFSGQDEPVHYITAQFLAEPKEKTWEITKVDIGDTDIARIPDLIASEEVKKTVDAAELETAESKHFFVQGYDGKNESEIVANDWKKYIETYPPSIVGSTVGSGKIYHQLTSLIEKIFAGQNILFRFFLIRIFSVSLGALALLLAYLIFKNSGFSEKAGLIMTAIISFQPKFTTYITNVNYDALLILVFTSFILGGILFLKNGPNWKNLLILAGSLVIGLFTKGTAIVLAGPLVALALFYIYQKLIENKINWKHVVLMLFLVASAVGLLFFKYDFQTIVQTGEEKISFVKFLSKASEKIPDVSENYWGNLKWIRNNFSKYFIRIIWAMEIVAAIGIVFFLFLKKRLDFLPEKKYVVFFLGMVAALLFGVLFSNWLITTSGREMLYTAPGRYFLPNLAAHIALVFTGIGMILRKEKYLECALLFGLVLMFIFNFYVTFNVLIPRFYL